MCNGLTPDQVKALVMSTGSALPKSSIASDVEAGVGELDLAAAQNMLAGTKKVQPCMVPPSVQQFPPSTGLGLLEDARGTSHVSYTDPVTGQPVELVGEYDVTGAAWDPTQPFDGFVNDSFDGIRWSGGTWYGLRWGATNWSGLRWGDAFWAGLRWGADGWTGSQQG
jgi:hypothetical protein